MGYTDEEIAASLGLARQTFSEKKSEFDEIKDALSRSRAYVNGKVRAAFLQTALGGRKVRQVKFVETRCVCQGKEKECPKCGGSGWIVSETERQVIETELAPNYMAQRLWLMNYDMDFRKRQTDIGDFDTPVDVKRGVNVKEWLKKEMEDKQTEQDGTDA